MERNMMMDKQERIDRIENSLKEWSLLNKTYRNNPDVNDYSV